MASSVALFVPCYVDQFFPHVAIAALDGARATRHPAWTYRRAQRAAASRRRTRGSRARDTRRSLGSWTCTRRTSGSSCSPAAVRVHVKQHAGEVDAHGGRTDAAGAGSRAHDGVLRLPSRRGRRERIAGLGRDRSRAASRCTSAVTRLRGLGLARPSEMQAPVRQGACAARRRARAGDSPISRAPTSAAASAGRSPSASRRYRLRWGATVCATSRRTARRRSCRPTSRASCTSTAWRGASGRASDVPRRRGAGGHGVRDRRSALRAAGARASHSRSTTRPPPRRSTPTWRAPTGTTTRSGSCGEARSRGGIRPRVGGAARAGVGDQGARAHAPR